MCFLCLPHIGRATQWWCNRIFCSLICWSVSLSFSYHLNCYCVLCVVCVIVGAQHSKVTLAWSNQRNNKNIDNKGPLRNIRLTFLTINAIRINNVVVQRFNETANGGLLMVLALISIADAFVLLPLWPSQSSAVRRSVCARCCCCFCFCWLFPFDTSEYYHSDFTLD